MLPVPAYAAKLPVPLVKLTTRPFRALLEVPFGMMLPENEKSMVEASTKVITPEPTVAGASRLV